MSDAAETRNGSVAGRETVPRPSAEGAETRRDGDTTREPLAWGVLPGDGLPLWPARSCEQAQAVVVSLREQRPGTDPQVVPLVDGRDPAPPPTLTDAEREALERLRSAATALYGHRWVCSDLSHDRQIELWEVLRNAVGLPPGTATGMGVAHQQTPPPTLTDAEREALERAAQWMVQLAKDRGEIHSAGYFVDDAATLRNLLARHGGPR